MPYIPGRAADDDDNDPVEVRQYELICNGNPYPLGLAQSPVYTRVETGSGNIYWRYFENGMIASSPNTCAHVLFGAIYDFYDGLRQFDGPLGFPTTDVTALPDGASYATFEHGVLYLASDGTVSQLEPLLPSYVQSLTANLVPPSFSMLDLGGLPMPGPLHQGLDPTIGGITGFAQIKLQAIANNAVAVDPRVSQHVSGIATVVSFDSLGGGGCAGASFNSAGKSLLPAHTFRVHFDFNLSGCAGLLGNATADLRITVRLFLNGAVSVQLQSYVIDGVSTPGGFGDDELRSGLTEALNKQYGNDLLNAAVPPGVNILGAIVAQRGNADVTAGTAQIGDVQLYIEPVCSVSRLVDRINGKSATTSLTTLRGVRDGIIRSNLRGSEFVGALNLFGALLIDRFARETDRRALFSGAAGILSRDTSHDDGTALHRELEGLITFITEASERTRTVPGYLDRLLSRTVVHLRDAIEKKHDLLTTLRHVRPFLEDDR